MRKILVILGIAVAILAASTPSMASIELGSRATAGGGLDGQGAWSGDGNNGVMLQWAITSEFDSGAGKLLYTYQYIISGASGTLWDADTDPFTDADSYSPLAQGLSHMILEVTRGYAGEFAGIAYDVDDLTPNTGDGGYHWQNTASQLDGAPQDYYGTGDDGSNPGLTPYQSVYGVKLETGAGEESRVVRIIFDSFREPVWGDFYAKDGKDAVETIGLKNAVWNSSFESEPAPGTVDFKGWIARPDGNPPPAPIPEPSTLAIWSVLALCGIGIGWRRRRR